VSQSEMTFDERLRRLSRKHRKLANGVVHRVGSDGLIRAYPRRRAPRFPLQGIVILVGAAFLFKSFLYASLGAVVYNERVDLLWQGSIVEKGGAWVMQADPATVWLGARIYDVIY
jgi:hypothetical protein